METGNHISAVSASLSGNAAERLAISLLGILLLLVSLLLVLGLLH